MDLVTVAGWTLAYTGVGLLVARVVYRRLRSSPYGNGENEFLALWAVLLWPVVVLLLVLLIPLGRSLLASWQWWLRD